MPPPALIDTYATPPFRYGDAVLYEVRGPAHCPRNAPLLTSPPARRSVRLEALTSDEGNLMNDAAKDLTRAIDDLDKVVNRVSAAGTPSEAWPSCG
jgi:hypothetical protein